MLFDLYMIQTYALTKSLNLCKKRRNLRNFEKIIDFMYFIFIIVIEDLNSNLFRLCFLMCFYENEKDNWIGSIGITCQFNQFCFG